MTSKATGKQTGRRTGAALGGTQGAGDAMSIMMRTQTAMMDVLLRQNIETMAFLRQRFEKDRALLATLAEAQDAGTAISAWSEFWSRAVADYAEEAARLGALAAESGESLRSDATGPEDADGKPGG